MSGFAHSLYSLLEGFDKEVAAPEACIVCHATTALPFASLTCRRDGCCKQIHIKCALEGSRWGNVGRVLLEDKRLPDLVYDCPLHHSEPLFCVCHKPMNEDPMIQCDECLEWYHTPCLLSDTTMGEESWVCSYCRYNLSRNNPEDLAQLKEKKIINKDKDVLATAIQAAQDNLLPFKHLVQNFTSVVDPIIKFTSPNGGEHHLQLNNAKLHLPQVHSAIEEFTKIIDSISIPERLGHVLTRAETLRYLCDVRQRLDKVASAYAVISATALDVAKNGNRLFANSALASNPFDGPLVSRLAPILDAAAKVATEFEAFPCSSEDDRAFLCYADGIRWIDAFCREMRGLSAQPDTPAKAQAIDDALRGSALVLRRFADLANEAARQRGVVKANALEVFSPTVATYRGVMTGVTLVSKAAKKLIRHRSFHSGLGGYGHQFASTSLGESDGGASEFRKGGSKSLRGTGLNQARSWEGLEEERAQDLGIALHPHPGSSAQPTPSPAGAAKQYSAAELRLVALFEAKDQEQRRLEAEKIERAKIIHKGSAYTSAPLPSAPVPAPAAAPAPAPAAAPPAAAAQPKPKPPAQAQAQARVQREGAADAPPLSSPRAASAAAASGAAGSAAAGAAAGAAAEAEAGTTKRPRLSATAAVEAAAVAAAAAAAIKANPLSIFDAPSTKRVRRNAELAEQVDEDEVVDTRELEGGIFRDPSGSLLLDSVWDPRSASSSVFLPLPNFGIIYDEDDAELRENNTLAVLMHVPEGAKQWAVNICPANHLDNHNILLHFNPRFAAGKQLRKEIAFNDRVGTWGDSFKERIRDPKEQEKNKGHPTAELLQMRVELLIQVRKEGFVIFVNGKCLCLFPHRRPLNTGEELVVSFPLKDDMAHLQEGQVHKVWWGRQPNALYSVPVHLLQGETQQKWREGTAYMMAHPARTRTVTVTGLPQQVRPLTLSLRGSLLAPSCSPSFTHLHSLTLLSLLSAISLLSPCTQSSPVELQFIEDGLRNVFGVKEIEPEAINVVPGRGVAFVRLKTKEEQQLALAELKRYKVQDTSGQKFALKLEGFDDSSPTLDFLAAGKV